MNIDKNNKELIFSEKALKSILRQVQNQGTRTLVLKDDDDRYVNIEKITFRQEDEDAV